MFLPTDFSDELVALLAFDSRGTRLAVSSKAAGHVLVFDVKRGREVARLSDLPDVEWLGFLSARLLLAVCGTGCVRLDLHRDVRETVCAEPWSRGAAVSPDGRVVAVGTRDGLVLRGALGRREARRLLGGGYLGSPRLPVFSPGGRYVAADMHVHEYPGAGCVIVWDARDGRRYRTFEAATGWLSAMAFRGDTLGLAVGYYDRISLYEPDEGEDPAVAYTVANKVSALRFTEDGESLDILQADGWQLAIRADTGRVVRQAPPPPGREFHGAIPGPDWLLLAGATAGGVVVWGADSG